MSKKNLSITLHNIDQKLSHTIEEFVKKCDLTTMNLSYQAKHKEVPCKLISIKLCDESRFMCSTTKEFFNEYRELNKNLQSLAFAYMKATNSFIEFEFGSCQ